ncbi:MAG: hypothetical protein DWG76_00315 [Chloroflexi bacterium]|nr:hypothetical protein [Chloroflexota bacterium]
MSENNLIDRYVFEVGNHLPRAGRDDVQMELRSALHDMLEEHGLDPDKKADEQKIAARLKEFGHPEKIATSYRPSRYLIGPQLFPIYTSVVKIVWGLMTALYALGILIGGIQGGSIWQQIISFFESYSHTLLYTLGIITAVFFALERTSVLEKDLAEEKEWDPLKLPAVKDPERIKRGEMIVEVFFTAAALVVFNAFLDNIGIPVIHVGQPTFLTRISDDFKTFVPLLSILWASELALKTIVLVRSHWQTWTRAGEVVLSAASIYLLYRIITEATILDLPIVDMIARGSIWVVLVVASIDLIAKTFRLFFPGRTPPWRRASLSAS